MVGHKSAAVTILLLLGACSMATDPCLSPEMASCDRSGQVSSGK